MEGKTVGMLFAFVFVVCFAAGLNYYFKIDEVNNAMHEAQSALKAQQSAVDSKKVQVEALQEQFLGLKKSYDVYISLSDSKKKLTNDVTALEAELDALQKRFITQVQSKRTASIGAQVPEIRLKSGASVKDVTFKAFTENEVTLNHALGVMKIPGNELPDDLNDKFRYGLPPMVLSKPIPTEQSTPASSAPAAQTYTPPPTVPSSSPQANTAAAKIQIDIDALEQKITNLETTKRDWLNRASTLRSQASGYSNKPTYNLTAQAIQAEQNAQLTVSQIEKLQEEQVQLRKKQVEAMSRQ
jgi:hypothetical protein